MPHKFYMFTNFITSIENLLQLRECSLIFEEIVSKLIGAKFKC